MGNLVGLVHNSRLPEAADFLNTLARSLNLKHRCWTSSAVDLWEMRDRLATTSAVVVAGGDGTILRTVRVVAPYSVPIIGINMGRVGFMTELTEEEAVRELPAYLEGGSRVEQRMMLEAAISPGSGDAPLQTLHALNDVVVGRGATARLLDIDTAVDGVPLTTYRADAVIVSTATGSTGYALSAGGPIIHPEAKVMLVQPVAAHLGLREGLILEQDSVVQLRPSDSHPPTLSVDGFSDVALNSGDKVTVKRSPYVALFLRAHTPNTFYTILSKRLGSAYRSNPPPAHD